MPSKSPRPGKRRRSTSSRWSRAAATAIVVLVALTVGYLTIRHRVATERATGCLAGSGRGELSLSISQAGIAATIAGVASERAMPSRAVAIAYAAALQESKLTNLPNGDRDSVGVFQQRPSEGWGTKQQIENPVYASTRFLAALADVPGYLHMPIYAAAQAVQHSADGSAYGQYAGIGSALARAFTGSAPHAVWCSYGAPVGKARLAAATRALTSAYGPVRAEHTNDPSASVAVRTARQGWSVAGWLVSNAANYGVTYVRFRGYEWHATSGPEHWVRLRGSVRGPAATADVVFG
ncbi:MAG: hypothetical protein ACLQFR_27520 [Streptosporangiaceae bacterium]